MMSKYDKLSFVFRSEKDLREWVKFSANENDFWIEPSLGSTQGLPDLFLCYGSGISIYVELKVGKRRGDNIFFSLTMGQAITIPRMIKNGAVVKFLVAEKLSSDIWVVDAKTALFSNPPQIKTVFSDVLSRATARDYRRFSSLIFGG